MKIPRLLFITTLSVTFFGAGCVGKPAHAPLTVRDQIPPPEIHGIALVTSAERIDGAQIVVIDPQTSRRFTSILPSNFTDKVGTYTGNIPGEEVHVLLSVKGTLEDDATLFRQQQGLEQFENANIGAWRVTTAYQPSSNRWVARAVIADPTYPEKGYHVIECLAAPQSYLRFWDGCRGIIEHATIGYPPAQ